MEVLTMLMMLMMLMITVVLAQTPQSTSSTGLHKGVLRLEQVLQRCDGSLSSNLVSSYDENDQSLDHHRSKMTWYILLLSEAAQMALAAADETGSVVELKRGMRQSNPLAAWRALLLDAMKDQSNEKSIWMMMWSRINLQSSWVRAQIAPEQYSLRMLDVSSFFRSSTKAAIPLALLIAFWPDSRGKVRTKNYQWDHA